ncbi:MAG: chorismate synthase [Bacteroidales bacterium]|jgi:chorismate synthase|nr:chorismate synthase [Bacteroidales bacterium]
MNTFGRIFRFTSFGESHGAAIGGVIDGMPAGISIDTLLIERELHRRATGENIYSSSRKEQDNVEILSGVFDGLTLGTPIGFIIHNNDVRSDDYKELEHLFRPSHADDTYFHKYGVRDWRGGGRASARETAVRVVVGAFAKMLLQQHGVTVTAKVAEVGGIAIKTDCTAASMPHTAGGNGVAVKTTDGTPHHTADSNGVAVNTTDGTPHHTADSNGVVANTAADMLLQEVRATGDSIGGIVECTVLGVPRGLGEPLYDKLTSRLAAAMMSINATRSFEIGQGLRATTMRGSEHNDKWNADGTTQNNYCGGVRGGISTGENIVMRVGFKPIPSIPKTQTMLSDKGELVEHSIHGRHDVTCVFRAVPIVEAMAAVCLADFILLLK